jgi:hypothetical protein
MQNEDVNIVRASLCGCATHSKTRRIRTSPFLQPLMSLDRMKPHGSVLPGVVAIPARIVSAALLLLSIAVIPASGQTVGGRSEVFAGSEFESYLRYLQTLGKSKPSVWSIRPLSPTQLDKLMPSDSLHPWGQRYDFSTVKRSGLTYDFVRPTTGVIANTAFPFGGNDGPIWAGKGATAWAQVGVMLRWGPISASLAPIAFRSANSDFELMDNGESGALAFGDGQFPTEIDRPQRFGVSAYSRADVGESTLRIDGAGLTAGISTASQWWGPTVEYPYILGNNAGGFPHVFFGTSRPLDIGFATAHGQVQYGYLRQSPFSPVTGKDYFESYAKPGRTRFMAGVVGAMQIKGVPGLEFGGGRFFHSPRDSSGITSDDLTLPLQNILKSRLPVETDTSVAGDIRNIFQNQLASVFLRWAPPRTGLDIYTEYGREDFSADVRDFMLEPDHSSTLNVGFRKAWLRGRNMNAVRAEFFNYETPSSGRTRGEGLIYLHQPMRQGHTYRGQALGANVGVGSGNAYLLAFERYSPYGRLKFFTSRATQHELSARSPEYQSGPPLKNPVDVQHSFGAETTRFLGSLDITGRAIFTSELNRYFLSDKSNLNFSLTLRQGF